MDKEAAARKLMGIFLPEVLEQSTKIQEEGHRFAYYTSAETAIEILTKRVLWMRNVRVMNDASEVEHGLEMLQRAFFELRSDFKATVDSISQGLFEDIEKQWSRNSSVWRSSTYVTCFSKHETVDDEYGRLSMWRAYGGRAGVALIVHGQPFVESDDHVGIYSTPVQYAGVNGALDVVKGLRARLANEHGFLCSLPREVILNAMDLMLRFTAVSMKHPAFKEEAERRVIYSPALDWNDQLKPALRTVAGVPQHIIELRLENSSEWPSLKLAPNDFIESVLIGPCDHPEIVFDALASAMTVAGIENWADRLRVTGVPLRFSR